MNNITVKAWAKINLTLDVLGKRPDGYHELSTVMQTVSLYDTIEIEKTTSPGIKLTTNCPDIPTDENNLAYKAAQLLVKGHGVFIHIKKNIPISAGLAGGSSDCAAVLHGLNKLFSLSIPEKKLLEIGRDFGADVPFCLMGGTAKAGGIGERLDPLPPHPAVSIVIARLPILVSTKEMFAKWSGAIRSENQTPEMVKAIISGDINKIADNLANDLAPIATGLHPEILELITAFREQGALGVNMTGSGPAIFAYFPTEVNAIKAIKHIGQKFTDCEMFCTQPKRSMSNDG